MMMRGMKYSQFQVAPKASLVWRGKRKSTYDITFNTSDRGGVLTLNSSAPGWPHQAPQGDMAMPAKPWWAPFPTRRALAPLSTLHQPYSPVSSPHQAGLLFSTLPTTPAGTLRDGYSWRCRVLQPRTGVLRARGHPGHVFPTGLIQSSHAHPPGWGKAAPHRAQIYRVP